MNTFMDQSNETLLNSGLPEAVIEKILAAKEAAASRLVNRDPQYDGLSIEPFRVSETVFVVPHVGDKLVGNVQNPRLMVPRFQEFPQGEIYCAGSSLEKLLAESGGKVPEFIPVYLDASGALSLSIQKAQTAAEVLRDLGQRKTEASSPIRARRRQSIAPLPMFNN